MIRERRGPLDEGITGTCISEAGITLSVLQKCAGVGIGQDAVR